MLSERDKVRHLLRRFGLGAGRYTVGKYEKLGFRGALDALLDEDRHPVGPEISPWEFAAQPDGRLDTGAYHLSGWWALRMLMTRRPLEERLALFWHDHFAVDYEKVFEMPMMAGYLEVLRTHGRGKFRDLLRAVFQQGAVYSQLDQHLSNRIHPNENCARELLELHTVGIGAFDERDVRETARALTGWSIHYLGSYTETPYEQLRVKAAQHGIGVNNACYVPAIHDGGEKTILGQTKNWDALGLLDFLAGHPKTAAHLCDKLWRWFAANPAKPETTKRLIDAWTRSDGEIKAVLRAIVEAPQFWEAQEIGHKPKSPVESVISLYRCFDVSDLLFLLRGNPPKPQTPIKKELRDAAGGLWYMMSLQGFILLLPPTVGGWEWGKAWINSATSIERLRLPGFVFYSGGDDRPMATLLAGRILGEDKPTSPEALVGAIADIFDVDLDPATAPLIVEAAVKAGGVAALADKNRAANLFARTTSVMFGLPSYQLY